MSIIITEISSEQTYLLRREVMWPNKPIEFIMLENDNKGVHFGLYCGDNIISVISLFVEEEGAQFRKFATALSEQGKGYGSILLNHIISVALDKKINRLWCNARLDKISFYEKFGMKRTDHSFMKSGIEYVIMERVFSDDKDSYTCHQDTHC